MRNYGMVSKSVEDAVKWRLFDETVSQVRDAFGDVPVSELSAMIDEAVAVARRDIGGKRKRRSDT